MTHILPVGCGGPDSFQAYCFGTQQLPGNKHKITLPSNMCPYVLISNFWWLTQRVNLTPEVGSRAAIFKMTVDLIQIWWPGGTSFIFCDLNMNVETWLSLELCPLVWWSGILPSLVHFYQTCLGSSWVLLWEVRPCKSRRGPPQGRACELCWWKGPLRPSACHLVAFFGGYLLSGLGLLRLWCSPFSNPHNWPQLLACSTGSSSCHWLFAPVVSVSANNLLLTHLLAWILFALPFPLGKACHSEAAFVSSPQGSHVVSCLWKTYFPLLKLGNPWDRQSWKACE